MVGFGELGPGAYAAGGAIAVAVLWWRMWRVERDVDGLRRDLKELGKELRTELRNHRGGARG